LVFLIFTYAIGEGRGRLVENSILYPTGLEPYAFATEVQYLTLKLSSSH
jgi:hypothetical protein